ncbi:MSMEG_6728 family protein [Thermobifida halotolerans]|uniref:MSMEG_6728 family protein n=1 Tax=Thermobifida halotolerans TaxID=483545 RepID=A0A399G6R5_9ACTN|nr:MSMEG_6728 family protein [Thermobifida halotolerans]UOE20870.1 MSMEG_6728 family protein [Thermobifida halotolerans]
MQTFLPLPTFAACAEVLDDRRLGKQRVETLQILRALVWPEYGWQRHPAVAMWRGFVPALVAYGVAVCAEWRSRGRADATLPALLEFTGGRAPREAELFARDLLPPWLGDVALHRSHRSALLRKDPEHYRPLFGDVPDGLPYVWPPPVFPRWPLRRARPDPLPVPAALELLDWADPPEEQLTAVGRLRDGRDATVRVGDPHGHPAVALLAGLCTPGATLWLVPGAPPPEPPPHDPTAAADFARTVGRISRSVARRPGPAETAATREEAFAEPEFHFRRMTPPGDTAASAPPGTGLLVVAGTDLAVPGTTVPVLRLLPPTTTP